jgi:hypothetical protein
VCEYNDPSYIITIYSCFLLSTCPKALGNNSKVLANNTNIGNPNAGKAASAQQKVTSRTPTNGLPSNPTKGSQKTAATGGSTQNKTGGTMTNMTAGTAKSAGTANSSKK